MTITGGLDLWPAEPAIPQADYVESLAAEGVPFELLDAAEVMRRWPQWRLEPDVTALWQRRAGWPTRSRATRAHRRLARAHGATLRDRTRVTGVRDAGGGDLEVVTEAGTVPDRPPGHRRRRLDQPAARRRSVAACRSRSPASR